MAEVSLGSWLTEVSRANNATRGWDSLAPQAINTGLYFDQGKLTLRIISMSNDQRFVWNL